MDNLEELPKHIVMFYEEPEYARMVALRFLKNGLERGELCKYDIPTDDGDFDADYADIDDKGFVEQEMQDYGIDTTYYKDKGLLHLYSFRENHITDFNSFRRGTEDAHRTLLKQFGSVSKFPNWRGIGRPHTNIKTNSGRVAQLQIEKYFQNDVLAKGISNSGTAICTYRLNNISEALDKQELWVKELIQSHDAVIYLPRNGNGLALRLR
jgi:hypothetical protein